MIVILNGKVDYIPLDFIVFISGVPGAGKSTISNELLNKFDVFRIIQETDLLRETIIGYNEFLVSQHQESANVILQQNQVIDANALMNFRQAKEQCSLYKNSISRIVNRQKRRKIPTIINGAHIVPEVLDGIANNDNIVFVNLYYSDISVLKERLAGRDPSSYMIDYVQSIFETNNALYQSTQRLAGACDYVFNIDITNLSISATTAMVIACISERISANSSF